MYLFIDTLSAPNALLLFDHERHIIDQLSWPEKHEEFNLLIEKIEELITRNKMEFRDVSGIITIVGPGGFTGTRVTTLVANTIGFSLEIPLFALTVGKFFALQNAPNPWILPITKRESLVWDTDEENPKLMMNAELYGLSFSAITPIQDTNILTNMMLDYTTVIENISLDHPVKKVEPIYAKLPNITLKKE